MTLIAMDEVGDGYAGVTALIAGNVTASLGASCDGHGMYTTASADLYVGSETRDSDGDERDERSVHVRPDMIERRLNCADTAGVVDFRMV